MSRRDRSIVVLVGNTDDETRDEAFRAAVGLTLRGAHVHVIVTDSEAALGAEARRARATLEMMGHRVTHAAAGAADEIQDADVVEVWGAVAHAPTAAAAATATATAAEAATATEAAAAAVGRTVHFVRPGRSAAVSAPAGAVLHLPPVLERDDADRLIDQLLAADRVVVW